MYFNIWNKWRISSLKPKSMQIKLSFRNNNAFFGLNLRILFFVLHVFRFLKLFLQKLLSIENTILSCMCLDGARYFKLGLINGRRGLFWMKVFCCSKMSISKRVFWKTVISKLISKKKWTIKLKLLIRSKSVQDVYSK